MYAKMYALFYNYLFCKFNNGFIMVSFAPKPPFYTRLLISLAVIIIAHYKGFFTILSICLCLLCSILVFKKKCMHLCMHKMYALLRGQMLWPIHTH